MTVVPTPSVTVAVLDGPNLNLLGRREPHVYGTLAYADLRLRCARVAEGLDVVLDMRQTNHEGQLIDWIHEVGFAVDGVVLNPGGLAHTSVALRDAVAAVPAPFVEVHLSNVYARETFRHTSYVSGVCRGVVTGLGPAGYEWALRSLVDLRRGGPASGAPHDQAPAGPDG